jgi:hypothetical protein
MYSKVYLITLLSALVASLAQQQEATTTSGGLSAATPLAQDVAVLFIPFDAYAQSSSDEGGSWGGMGIGAWEFAFNGGDYKEEAFEVKLYSEGATAVQTGGVDDYGTPTATITVSLNPIVSTGLGSCEVLLTIMLIAHSAPWEQRLP